MNRKEIGLLVDSVHRVLKRLYIYPDKADLAGKTIKDHYRAGDYSRQQNRNGMADRLTQDLRAAHNDKHMRVIYAPEFEKALLTSLADSIKEKEDEMEVNYERSQNFHFSKTEILPGNIGYIRWDEFAEHTREARVIYEAAFRFLSNANALIIDMRYNRGGWPPTVNDMLNYFFEKKLPMNHLIDYRHDTTKYFTDPSSTSFKLTCPVYLLTSKRTFSGAEDFTYAMKAAGRAIIVGDTTGGGAHPVVTVPLGQGFVMRVPNARSYNEVTGTDWEGTGVYPHVYVKSEYALEMAQLLICREFLTKASGQEENQQAQRMVTAAENRLTLRQSGSLDLSNEQLQKYCGEYRPVPGPGASPVNVSIFRKGCSLYRRIPYPPDWKLTPISHSRFVYDADEGNRYMEFSFDKAGNAAGLIIYYTDGTTYSYLKAE